MGTDVTFSTFFQPFLEADCLGDKMTGPNEKRFKSGHRGPMIYESNGQ